MHRKDSARRHTAVLKWLLRLVIKKKWPQGKWPVFPESVGRVHKCFPHSQSGCHERECQSKATLKGTCPCGQLHRHNGALQRQSSYQEPTAEKYHLHQGKPGERWTASKRGSLKNFKDPRDEMHSKNTPKLEETGIGARETIISSSSFDPQGGGINRETEESIEKNSATLISFANFLSKIGPGWEFPGGLVVRTWCFHCWGLSSICDWGTKIPPAMWCNKKQEPKSTL